MYLNRHLFYFETSHEETGRFNELLEPYKATRQLLAELCYKFNLKILPAAEEDKYIRVCTGSGFIIGGVSVYNEAYRFLSPLIKKERGEERSVREYSSLRSMMRVLSEDFLKTTFQDADLFNKFYGPYVSSMVDLINDWFSSSVGEKQLGLLDPKSSKILDFSEQIEILDAVFSGSLTRIQASEIYNKRYETAQRHLAAAKERDDFLNRMLTRSVFIQMERGRNATYLVAEMSIKKGKYSVGVDNLMRVKRVRNLEEFPEALANLTMLKTGEPKVAHALNDPMADMDSASFFYDYETAIYMPWSRHRDSTSLYAHRTPMLMIVPSA